MKEGDRRKNRESRKGRARVKQEEGRDRVMGKLMDR